MNAPLVLATLTNTDESKIKDSQTVKECKEMTAFLKEYSILTVAIEGLLSSEVFQQDQL
jgi:hypothetical protein